MLSIERLFCLLEPQALSISPVAGRGVFSREDAAGVVGQVVHYGYAVGVTVLQAKVGNNERAKRELVDVLSRYYASIDVAAPRAKALAEMAVFEVCGNQKCPKCKGTGQSFSKRYNRFFRCGRCDGSGHHFSTMREFVITFGLLAKEPVTTEVFRKQFYDHLMDGIDTLEREQGEAAKQCAKILRLTEAEVM